MTTLQDVLGDLEAALTGADDAHRGRLLSRFTDQMLSHNNALTEEHVGAYDEVIYNLARDIEYRARVELAQRIAEMEMGPRKTLRDLAYDDNAEVAGPVLQHSPRLEESDLVAIAKAKGQDHLMALSKRRGLTEMVTDIIVDRGESQVRVSVASNESARFSHTAMDKLAQHAKQDGALAEALVARHDIPAAVMKGVVDQARAMAAARLGEHADDRTQALIGDAVQRGIESIETSGQTFSLISELGESERRVASMANRSTLEEGDVIAHLEANQLGDAVAILAHIARLPTPQVVLALSAGQVDAILAILRLADFSWPGVEAIIRKKAGGNPPVRLLQEAKSQYEKISHEAARRAVRFLSKHRYTPPAPTHAA